MPHDLFERSAAAEPSYSARDIEVLEGLEPVRRRPGMYIGGTDEAALHHLVAGHASQIEPELHADGSVSARDLYRSFTSRALGSAGRVVSGSPYRAESAR